MFAFLLERMELSSAFSSLENKVSLPPNARLKLDRDVIHCL